MIETVPIACPYCGETVTMTVDCSAGSLEFIEDCSVCCRPIEFRLEVGASGELLHLEPRRDDE